MKTYQTLWIIVLILCVIIPLKAQETKNDSIGLPGDNLNLQGVLNSFKESTSMEDFEKRLNDSVTKINNLDLNNDGKIDFLKVTDYGKNDVHSLVIQDMIDDKETQDIAVIQIEKKKDQLVNLRIVGDETLYGPNYIIEPEIEVAANPGETQAAATPETPSTQQNPTSTVSNINYYSAPPANIKFVNVWEWPSVKYLYAPSYVLWVSPWHWGYYPSWWSPRRPYSCFVYRHGWHHHHWGAYRRGYESGFAHAKIYYYGRRLNSATVQRNIDNHVYAQREVAKTPAQRDKSLNEGSAPYAGLNKNHSATKSVDSRGQSTQQHNASTTASNVPSTQKATNNSAKRSRVKNVAPNQQDRAQRANNSGGHQGSNSQGGTGASHTNRGR